jgi:UDPglucose 6-dehydrogenase
MSIGIVGHGFVGKAVEFGFGNTYDILINDKFKPELSSLKEVLENCKVTYFCLPTPFDDESMHIDLAIYDEVIKEASELVSGKIFVIKSTVVPGTTQDYQERYPNNHFVFNPEFLTEKNFKQDFINTKRIVLGGEQKYVDVVKDVYRKNPHFKKTPIITMNATEAEIVKYQANVILATRVAISNYFYDICQATGSNYEAVREGVITDVRIGSSHSSVTEDRGFGGKCFVKDLAAIIGKGNDLGVDTKLPQEVFDYNNRIRKNKDWEEIPGATSSGKKYD